MAKRRSPESRKSRESVQQQVVQKLDALYEAHAGSVVPGPADFPGRRLDLVEFTPSSVRGMVYNTRSVRPALLSPLTIIQTVDGQYRFSYNIEVFARGALDRSERARLAMNAKVCHEYLYISRKGRARSEVYRIIGGKRVEGRGEVYGKNDMALGDLLTTLHNADLYDPAVDGVLKGADLTRHGYGKGIDDRLAPWAEIEEFQEQAPRRLELVTHLASLMQGVVDYSLGSQKTQ